MNRIRQCAKSLRRDECGAVLLEFVLVFPIMLTAMMGVLEFGWNLNNWNALTNATAAGARQLSISRGDATAYDDTINAFKSAAGTMLTITNVTITISVNGTTCSDNASCSSALNSATGLSAKVSAKYPCTEPFYSCTLNSTLTMSVQ